MKPRKRESDRVRDLQKVLLLQVALLLALLLYLHPASGQAGNMQAAGSSPASTGQSGQADSRNGQTFGHQEQMAVSFGRRTHVAEVAPAKSQRRLNFR